ncbi:MAG: enoyl-CoA hydratase/isomerase family protein [Ardenticatenaceae bacterium]|nr:enoyl-CoA hydratase/isomerase family protein [Ardenticatenaceae bacterium]
MSEQVVTFAKAGKVGTITLNRPPANSYEIEFMRQLGVAIGAAEADTAVRVIILRSASEKFFSAGADIKAFLANSTEDNMAMIHLAHGELSRMAASRKIYIAAINGHALGGGLEMALACDLRVAVDSGREGSRPYYLGLPEVTLGILPGNGGTQRLPRLIGANKALEMMILGERVTPQQALELGIVNKLFPAESFNEDVQAYAERIANGASVAIGAIKRAVYDGLEMALAEGLALERDLIAPLYDTEDATEGFAAFSEKREPVYKGR